MQDITQQKQQHLRNLSIVSPPFDKHIKFMNDLKEKENFNPKVIYDIGSCVMHWTNNAKKVWPDAQYILFDAFDTVEFLYKESGHKYHIGVLSDEDGKTVNFYQNDTCPGGNSYYKEIGHGESSKLFPETCKKEMITNKLDTIVERYNFPPPDFIKIDVQGSEMDVLKGGHKTLSTVKHMIVEMQHTEYNQSAPKVNETKPYIESLGFICTHPMLVNNGADADYAFARKRRIL